MLAGMLGQTFLDLSATDEVTCPVCGRPVRPVEALTRDVQPPAL